MYIGLRNAFTIPKDPMVRAKRQIYEGMKRRFKWTPEQRAKTMIYRGLKKHMTRPRGHATFHNPDFQDALKQLYEGLKKNMTRPRDIGYDLHFNLKQLEAHNKYRA